MRPPGVIALALLFACACAGGPPVAGPVASDSRLPSLAPTPGAKGGSPPPTPGVPAPLAQCVAKPGNAMVLVGGALYDVTDPLHPRLLCLIRNTVAHLFTGDTFQYVRASGDSGTEVVLHSIGSGNESVVAGWPLRLLDPPAQFAGAWTTDGNSAATMTQITDSAGNVQVHVWLFAQPTKTLLYSFPLPLTDCICRFGLTGPVVAFSADGQYLVSGWPIGKGATGLRVYRVADASLVATLKIEDNQAIWSRTGHTLYASGQAGSVSTWSPEVGLGSPTGAAAWQYLPGLSPDGKDVAYAGYTDPANFVNLRVFIFDLATQSTRLLIDKPRSDVTFVKDGWVWYDEEGSCADCAGQSRPTGTVFAMDLSTGVEQKVAFAAGESPADLKSELTPGQFWPNS